MKPTTENNQRGLRFKLLLTSPQGRSAERLVLDGYRGWRRGLAARDMDALERFWKQFEAILGDSSAALAFSAMADFVHALDLCSSCPLRGRAVDDARLHPDEALVIGLVSSLQNDDTRTAEFCLNALTCASRCQEVGGAASMLAMALKSGGHTLLPASIELQQPLHTPINQTVH